MRTRIIIISIVILIIFSGAGLITWQQKQIKTLNLEKEQLVQVALDSGRQARTYKNSYGRLVSVNKVLALTVRNARAISANREFKLLKELDGVKANLKNVQTVVNVQADVIFKLKMKNTSTVDSPQTTADPSVDRGPWTVDSARFFTYQDEYNFINGLSLPDSTQITGEIQVPIEGGVYWTRKHKFIFKNWRFGAKEYFSALTSPNPWVYIKQHEIIKVGKQE